MKKTKIFTKKKFSVKWGILSLLLFLLVEILTVSSARAQTIEVYSQESVKAIRDICERDLNDSGSSDQKFINTPCGMYMMGYIHASFSMWYSLISETGYSEGTLKVVKNKPFCVESPLKSSDVARLFVEEAKLNEDRMKINWVLLTALHKKYPCDEFFKEMDHEFETNGVVTK